MNPPPRPSPRARRRLQTCVAPALCVAALLLWPCAPRAAAQETNAAPAEGAKSQSQTPARRGREVDGAIGSITGRVVGDDGQPLAGVWVWSFSGALRHQAATLTGEDGTFRFDNLSAGVYTVSANAPAYVSDPLTQDAPPSPRYFRVGSVADLRLIKGGVISGSVTDANGNAVVAVNVRAVRVRKPDGQPATDVFWVRERPTDDRGFFRIYGLLPGVYIVSAGGSRRNFGLLPGAYDADAPIYFPSGTQDSAGEIIVQAGQEVEGVDIRYRRERGQTVSGIVVLTTTPGDQLSINVTLLHAATGMPLGNAFINPADNTRSFTFEGLADGDYEVQARYYPRNGAAGASAPQRVSVRGADVTGLKLTPAPLGSISGKLVLEPMRDAARAAGGCAEQRPTLLPQETVVNARREKTDAAEGQPRPRPLLNITSSPNEDGDFTLRNLEPGRFYVGARPLDENWYVRAVETTPSPAPATAKAGAVRSPLKGKSAATTAQSVTALDLKPGQNLSGVTIRLAEGAASLSGRVVPPEAVAPNIPAIPLRVHLIPAGREHADNLLRYAEVAPAADGAFAFNHLAPGKYLLLARANESAPPDATARHAAQDAEERARLRREAEAGGLAVELQSCQRLNDYSLRLPPAK